ncbi:hypothetical protein NDU88_005936 [Pleurodeles waltl]|uniref:Uncharacterized protein n=1 Tax=Pleurodeles waltl TaxID=8319 RepID=A0AAV7RLN4_PLEWA|nr:hypothetical protein NDU88_005936 [Pleurodeles waltl]
MEPSKVVKALKVLQDEGREDLLREWVLEEAWVGLRRPKRLSAEGVSAAVAACTSPVSAGRKFRVKSATGRKLARLPVSDDTSDVVLPGPPLAVSKRRGICSLPRRQGSSLRSRVAGGCRSLVNAAVAKRGRMGAQIRFAHARIGLRNQACAPYKTSAERERQDLEEGTLAGTSKMAAPIEFQQQSAFSVEKRSGSNPRCDASVLSFEEEVVVISDDEEEVQVSQIELVDQDGNVFKGTVCGERCSSGAIDRAYVSLDLSKMVVGVGPSGCDTSHVSGEHGLQAIHQRSGRIVGEQSLPVKVRAPSLHRLEGRVKPGAVYPTSGETFGDNESEPSTSRGAGGGLASMEEELLDYDEEFEETVSSRHRVCRSGEVSGEAQGGPSKAHVQDITVGGFPRGELGLVGSVRAREFRKSGGGSGGARVFGALDGSKEHRSKTDACIQDNAVHFVMQQIEAGLAAVTISACSPSGSRRVEASGERRVRTSLLPGVVLSGFKLVWEERLRYGGRVPVGGCPLHSDIGHSKSPQSNFPPCCCQARQGAGPVPEVPKPPRHPMPMLHQGQQGC